MDSAIEILVGGLTLGLPLWFAFLDQQALPRLRWIEEGEAPPLWGRMVVLIGVALAALIAFGAPISGFHPTH
ncbi:MAG: hypothetical protein PVJ76_01645 [Gemmatimonadota bacterium]